MPMPNYPGYNDFIDHGDFMTVNGFPFPKDKGDGSVQPRTQAWQDDVRKKMDMTFGANDRSGGPNTAYTPPAAEPPMTPAPMRGTSASWGDEPPQGAPGFDAPMGGGQPQQQGGRVSVSMGGGGGIPGTEPGTRQRVTQAAFAGPPSIGGIEQATKKELDANTRLADAQARTSDAVATKMGLANEQQQQNLQKQNEHRQYVDENVARRRQSLDQESDQLANEKIDSNRFWHNKGNGEKFMAGISVFLGEMGKTLTGSSENPGLKMINDAITRDIDEQKTNREGKERSLGRKRQSLQDFQASEQAVDTRTTANAEAMWKIAQNQIEQLKAKSNSEEVKGKLDILNAQIGQKLEEIKYKADIQNRQTAQQQLGLFMQSDQLALARQANALKKKEVDQKAYFETSRAAAKEKEEFERFRQQVPLIKEDYRVLKEMGWWDAIAPDFLGGHQSPAAAKHDLVLKIADTTGLKTDQGTKMIESLLPNPTDNNAIKAQKAESFARLIKAYRPATPILQAHGEIPTPRNVSSGYAAENLGAEDEF